MSLEQYKDANRKELWEILQAQAELIEMFESKMQTVQADKLRSIAKERKRWAREDLTALAIRDLEQQAKGVQNYVKRRAEEVQNYPWFIDAAPTLEYLYDYGFGMGNSTDAIFYIEDLNDQAKALKNT